MRTQMYEAASSLVSFTTMSKAGKTEVKLFRHKIVRLFSLMHAMTLVAIADQNDHYYPIVDIESIPDKYLKILKSKSRRQKPEIVYQWINHTIVRAIDNGLLNIPPPILSRVFQELEKAMVEYNQVMQIMTIHFPFPYAQCCVVLICLYALFAPIVMVSWVSQPVMGALFTFTVASCYFSLELIAAELENPFGDDWNDLPCRMFQDDMNEGLVLLIEPSANSEFELGEKIATHKQLVEDRSTWLSFEEECENHHIIGLMGEEWSDDEEFMIHRISQKTGTTVATASADLQQSASPEKSLQPKQASQDVKLLEASDIVVAQKEVPPDKGTGNGERLMPDARRFLDPSVAKPPIPIGLSAKDRETSMISVASSLDGEDGDGVERLPFLTSHTPSLASDRPVLHKGYSDMHSRNSPQMIKMTQIRDTVDQCRLWLAQIHGSLERRPLPLRASYESESQAAI